MLFRGQLMCSGNVCSVVWLFWTRHVSPVKINYQSIQVHGDGLVRMWCVRKWCSRLKMIGHLPWQQRPAQHIKGRFEWGMSGGTDIRSWSNGQKVTNSTIMRKWKLLFMNGYECKNRIYMTVEFLSLCQGVRGVLGLCWKVIFHCNRWATLNTVMASHTSHDMEKLSERCL